MSTCTWSWNGSSWVLTSHPEPMPSSGCAAPTAIPRGDVPDQILPCGGGPGVGQGSEYLTDECCTSDSGCCENRNELETVSLL